FSSRRRHTRSKRDWSSDVCSSDLTMSKYIKEATLEEATSDNKEKEIIAQLIKDYKQIIGEISTEGIPLAQERNDRPTVDLLTTLQSGYEKYKWMLHAYCGLDS